jgi:membrane associated rhomboid family serine protease
MVDLYRIYAAPMLGASGAIYGILVAFGLMYPDAKLALLFLPVPIAAKYFIPIILALDLFSGVTGFSLFGGGIAHFAHIGGALIGFLLMWYWRSRERSVSQARWQQG